ncbi:MAG: hypothetical protein M3Q69_08685 [Acidobacteriota bacterium]|nr:hypothetical protein [Acidobacteriota bacterium]
MKRTISRNTATISGSTTAKNPIDCLTGAAFHNNAKISGTGKLASARNFQ